MPPTSGRSPEAGSGFEVVVRVARLALQSSAEGVEVLERSVATSAAAYDVQVDLVIQVPTVAPPLAVGVILSDGGGPHKPPAGPGP